MKPSPAAKRMREHRAATDGRYDKARRAAIRSLIQRHRREFEQLLSKEMSA